MRARARAPWIVAALIAAPAGAFEDPLDVPARPTPLAARGLLTAVAAAGARLVAVGERGHVVWSDDGGATWRQAAVPVSTDLTAVAFPSPRRGFAVGHGGVVLATEDGGATWTRRLATGGPEDSLLDVWFDDERSGFAVGEFDLVLSTADGGATWTRWKDRTDNPRRLHLHAIRRVGGELLVAGEAGLVLRLDGAAGRFRALRTGYAGSLFGVTGRGGTAVVHGLRGHALASDDRGATWRAVETGVEATITASAVLPGGRIAAATIAGDLLVAAAAGAPFRRVAAGGPPASGLAPAGADAVVVVGPAGARRERIP